MSTSFSSETRRLVFRICQHILFWVSIYAYNILESWNSIENKTALFELYTTRLPLQMGVAYLLTYHLIPSFLIKRKYIHFFFFLFLSAYITCVLYAVYRAFYFEVKYPDYFWSKTDSSYRLYYDVIRFLMYATSLYTPAAAMAFIKLVRTQSKNQQERQMLENEKLQTELSFLKNQLNPHFLFNTLNNLYMLTLKASPEAPNVVAKLSETLDYVLYRCHERFVPLKGEIQLLEGYLSLEKLRLNENAVVHFSCQGSIDFHNIAPLIMLSLVENAFKHGVSSGIGKSEVDIRLRLDESTLTFSVYNTKGRNVQANSHGIGLKNIRRQLELIYPGRHSLRIDEQESTYSVELQLQLDKQDK